MEAWLGDDAQMRVIWRRLLKQSGPARAILRAGPLFRSTLRLVARSTASASSAATGSTSTAATEAPAACGRRSTGDGDVLHAIQHEGHRRTDVGQVSVHVEEFLAGIGAINPKSGSHAGEDQIPGG
jgi:hypothetical protein